MIKKFHLGGKHAKVEGIDLQIIVEVIAELTRICKDEKEWIFCQKIKVGEDVMKIL